MNPKYPSKAFDGTNTTDVQVLNVPAESVGENGEVNLNAGVKVYRALLTQTGTDAPVATVLENTLGETPVWAYVDVGIYTLTKSGDFPTATTFIQFNVGAGITPDDGQIFTGFARNVDGIINVKTGKLEDTDPVTITGENDVLALSSIEILGYS